MNGEEYKDASDIIKIYVQYRDRMTSWLNNISDDISFNTPGGQWSQAQVEVLASRGQAASETQVIVPQIEHQKSMIIAKMPKFKMTPRTDDDVRRAALFNKLTDYVCYKSNLEKQLDECVTNQLMVSKGYLYVGYSPTYDDGKPLPYIDSVRPQLVVVDPESRESDEEDASWKFITDLMAKDRAKIKYPQFSQLIDDTLSSDNYVMFYRNMASEQGIEILDEVTDVNREKIRCIEAFQKIVVKYFRIIYQGPNGKTVEIDLHEEEFEQFKSEIDPNAPDTPALLDAIDEIQPTYKTRIKRYIIIGTKIVYEEVLPTEYYPIIPVPYQHFGNPYTVSLTRRLKGPQLELNQRRSLMIAHAIASTNFKVLVPRGSVDEETIEDNWSRPNAVIFYDPTLGAPLPVGPSPLPNALYQLEASTKKDIEYLAGTYSISHGDPDAVGNRTPYRGILALDEYSSRRTNLTARVLYYALATVGKVLVSYLQYYLRNEVHRIIRMTDIDNPFDEGIMRIGIGEKFKDGEVEAYLSDINTGSYDVSVIVGSMAPNNRYAEVELYQNLYQMGIIDDVEFLKKTDLFDRDGLLERKSIYSQMQQKIKAQEDVIENMQRDIQELSDQLRNAKSDIERTQADKMYDRKIVDLQAQYDRKMLELEMLIQQQKMKMKGKES